MNSPSIPWSDCKVAFDLDHPELVDRWLESSHGKSSFLPPGWSLVELDSNPVQPMAIFRVDGIPSPEDGQKAKELLLAIQHPKPSSDLNIREWIEKKTQGNRNYFNPDGLSLEIGPAKSLMDMGYLRKSAIDRMVEYYEEELADEYPDGTTLGAAKAFLEHKFDSAYLEGMRPFWDGDDIPKVGHVQLIERIRLLSSGKSIQQNFKEMIQDIGEGESMETLFSDPGILTEMSIALSEWNGRPQEDNQSMLVVLLHLHGDNIHQGILQALEGHLGQQQCLDTGPQFS